MYFVQKTICLHLRGVIEFKILNLKLTAPIVAIPFVPINIIIIILVIIYQVMVRITGKIPINTFYYHSISHKYPPLVHIYF